MDAPAGGRGLHGLLPPLQRDTLAFERPVRSRAPMDTQGAAADARSLARLAEAQHARAPRTARCGRQQRDRVVASRGASAAVSHRPRGRAAVLRGPGGRQHRRGSGRENRRRARCGRRSSVEMYGLVSRFVPDREDPRRTRDGRAWLGRASVGRAGWVGHVLFWRGDDFIKDEGDPNYLSLRRDGRYYGGIRDYAEAGLMRTFHPAPGVVAGRVGTIPPRRDALRILVSDRRLRPPPVAGAVMFRVRVRGC